MRVVITGGAGFVGRKLVDRLLRDGEAAGPDGAMREISEIVVFDQTDPVPPLPDDRRVRAVAGDISDRATVEGVIAEGTGSVFHLAAVVSAAAEADLDLGLRVNLDGTRAVIDACRTLSAPPRLVFASSCAVYGGEPPVLVDDLTPPDPRTSYGAQKACGELLVNDYSRRGIVDGRAVRLPTIVVRPGKPNKAASTFASSILREPLSGVETICPVEPRSRMAILSPRRLIDCLMTLHNMNSARLGAERRILLPSISVTIGEMVEGLERAGGREAVDRIKWQRDDHIQSIVDHWPARMEASRAAKLGLVGDRSVDEMIAAFVEDDLPAQKALAQG